jgi:ligand-binding sensor domain-containing protein
LIIAEAEGIWLLDAKSFVSKRIFTPGNIVPFSVSSLFFDKNQNKLWMGTMSNGLLCYDFNKATFSYILQSTLPKQPVLTIKENSGSSLLIGIDGQGIWELSKLFHLSETGSQTLLPLFEKFEFHFFP